MPKIDKERRSIIAGELLLDLLRSEGTLRRRTQNATSLIDELGSGIAISSAMMEMVPMHFMGRLQNTLLHRHTPASCDEYRVGAIAEHMVLALAFATMGVM